MAASDFAFDVDAYAAKYQSGGKIRRLAFVAEHATSQHIRSRAIELAADAISRESCDAFLYRSVTSRAGASAPAPQRFDPATFDRLQRAADSKVAAITKELEVSKARAQREDIRRNLLELAQAYRESGDLNSAATALTTSREYATNAKQLADINMILLEVAMLMPNFHNVVPSLTARLAASADAGTPIVAAKLRAAQGLSALSGCQYEAAARELLQVPLRLGDAFSCVVHVEEVALYACLTAMATFSREELRASVMTSPTGRQLLELVPPVRDALVAFVNSKYASCLEALHSLQSDYLALDLYLAPHVEGLLRAIRKRALQQYLTPYTSVDLRTMAAAFRIAVGPLETEIAALIGEGGLKARLDSDRKLLHAHTTDERRAALEGAVATSAAFAAQARMLLLRASMEAEGLFVGAQGQAERAEDGASAAPGSTSAAGAETIAAASDSALDAAGGGAARDVAPGEAPADDAFLDVAAESLDSMLAEAAAASGAGAPAQ